MQEMKQLVAAQTKSYLVFVLIAIFVLSSLCKKASQKLNALTRIAQFIVLVQRRSRVKVLICSQFGYCPLVWMFHSRKINNRINSLHERVLRVVYRDHNATFSELLSKDK